MAKEIDKSGDLSKEASEALDALAALSQKQLQLYKMTITDELKNAEQSKTLPITSIIKRDGMTRAYISQESSNISGVVDDVSGIFFGLSSGDGMKSVVKGIGAIAKAAVTAFLGDTEGSDETMEKYLAYTDGVALLRFDLLGWKRSVVADSLRTRAESVSAFYFTVSVIDARKVDFQTFVALYQDVLNAGTGNAEEIKKMLDDLRDIYSKLTQLSDEENMKIVANAYGNQNVAFV